MTGPLSRILGWIGSKKGTGRGRNRMMHLPADIRSPSGLVLFSGPMESDVWPALYMINSLQTGFPDVELDVICPKRDNGLFSMLRWRPPVHCYSGKPAIPDTLDRDRLNEDTVFYYPYSKVIESDSDLLAGISCGVRIAPLDHPSPLVNLTVRTESPYFPEKLEQMCRLLGLTYDNDWRPAVQTHAERAEEQIMAPVTGRMLPYIVTTSSALAILEKSRAEIPLRTVSLAGKNSDLCDLDRELKTAIVAGASAVATDNDDLWGDACAFDVPVVGLDRLGDFIKWHGVEASRQESDFVEAWVALLKRGW